MNCKNMQLDHFELVGNYSFDGVENMEIHHARMLSKDAFWNSNHVTVYDSFISGEYLGWNARNLTLVNCTIESLQGMCYIENLKMVNCKLINTTLAFEYSTVDAQIVNTVDSVLNPSGGIIRADKIGKLILEKDKVDPGKTTIICTEDEGEGHDHEASHRKDVIIARIIFAIICAALLAGIISLIVWLHGRNAGKNQTPETEITNNAPPADNSNLPPVTEQPLDEDGQSVWTSTDGVNFRAEPNTDSEILTVLVTGTKLTLLGEENGWVQAEYNGQKGYVSSDYVTDQEPDTTTQETE